MTGKPAMLYETSSPNWLPTLNLGHKKQSARTPVNTERYERVIERVRRNTIEELMKELPVVVSQLLEEVIAEEVKVTATKELEISREYIKITVGDSGESTKCDSASKIETLQRELNSYKLTVERLTQQLKVARNYSCMASPQKLKCLFQQKHYRQIT